MGNRYAAVSPYDSFTCKGGKVIIAAGNQKLYEKLCNEVLERPDMITDPRFVDMPAVWPIRMPLPRSLRSGSRI